MRRAHDMGGLKAGRVATTTHDLDPWEKTSQAVFNALSAPGRQVVSIHMLRRAIEDLPAPVYRRLGYFERRCQALANLLIEGGVLTAAEIALRARAIAARGGKPARKRLGSRQRTGSRRH